MEGSGILSNKQPLIKLKWDSRCGPLLFISYGKKTLSLALLCHRKPERSFKFFGHQSLLCARCSGLFVGFFMFLGLSLFNFSAPLIPALLMMCPMLIDGFTQLFGLRESNNPLRFMSGTLFTIGCLYLMVKL
jgi:uncharacterized membrane protein